VKRGSLLVVYYNYYVQSCSSLKVRSGVRVFYMVLGLTISMKAIYSLLTALTKKLAEFILCWFDIGLYNTFWSLVTISKHQMVDNFVDSTHLSTFVHISKCAN
jgi:hypothetical protein